MIMKHIHPYLVILLCLIFASCEKESAEEAIKYPITYKSYSISDIRYRIFTSDGEISSTPIKQDIINRHKDFLTDSISENFEDRIIVTYTTQDSVQVSYDGLLEEKQRKAIETPEMIYWEKQDTLMFENINFPFFENYFKYTSLFYEEFQVPTATGFTRIIKTMECYYATKKREEIILPMLDYYYKNEYEYFNMKGINNELIENPLFNLPPLGTLIVMEYQINMK